VEVERNIGVRFGFVKKAFGPVDILAARDTSSEKQIPNLAKTTGIRDDNFPHCAQFSGRSTEPWHFNRIHPG